MSRRARRRGEHEESKIALRAEAARDRCTEGEQPHPVETEVRPVAVDQRVTEEGPDARSQTRNLANVCRHRCVVARRDEREPEQQLCILLRRQHEVAHEVHKDQHHEHGDNRRGHIEDRLTAQSAV